MKPGRGAVPVADAPDGGVAVEGSPVMVMGVQRGEGARGDRHVLGALGEFARIGSQHPGFGGEFDGEVGGS
ncbi:hypothetical protein [Streptomyces sp. NPDC047043]|uniref:hypothetical protein n=1 Tax=Streptomyces sp. NPDC047043 TaxID=3154497 RepID=UPI00340097D7